MRAFVLSGGGNRGPLEVGALQALLEAGITPEMIAGSSAGALNGAFLAIAPCLEQVRNLADLWRESGPRKTVQMSPLRTLLQLARRRAYLIDNRMIVQFVRQALPPDKQCFGDLPIPLYVTIAHLMTHTLYVYGDDPAASIADAVVTSAAVPGFFPPTIHNGEVFVDGGVISNVPVCLAIARGATEIWAIDLAMGGNMARGSMPGGNGSRQATEAFSILGRSIFPVLYNDVLRELECALRTPGVTLHHIPIYAHQDVMLGNFSQTESMLVAGAQAVREYLARPEPNVIHYPRRWQEHELPPGPPGSRPFLRM